MKKHIFGLAIFSFVVFAAAFIYGILSFNNTVNNVYKYETPLYVPFEETNCKFKREINQSDDFSSNVAQAVYSVKTKKLTWQGNLPNEKNATHFDLWAADGKGFDYLGAMRVNNIESGDAFASDDFNISLSKIAPSVNLYLIAESDKHFKLSETESTLQFNVENAVPVTIDYGK